MRTLAIVEFRNSGPILYEFVGVNLTLDRIVKFLEDMEDFNEERDSVTIVKEVNQIALND